MHGLGSLLCRKQTTIKLVSNQMLREHHIWTKRGFYSRPKLSKRYTLVHVIHSKAMRQLFRALAYVFFFHVGLWLEHCGARVREAREASGASSSTAICASKFIGCARVCVRGVCRVLVQAFGREGGRLFLDRSPVYL